MIVLRWLTIIALFAAAAEGAARAEDYFTWGASFTEPYSDTQLTVRDSLGTHGRANYRYQKWRMNNFGFRGADVSRDPIPGKTRVVLLGASETFGLYESPNHEYAALLQQRLDSLAPGRYEIVNVGLPGLSLSSMVPYYQNVVRQLQPAYVFVYPSPSFYLEINPLPPVYIVPRVRNQAPAKAPFQLRMAGKMRESLKSLVPPQLIAAIWQRRLAAQRAAQPADWVWTGVPEDRMQIMRGHVAALVDSIQATGPKVVMVTHTNRFVGAAADTATGDRRHLTNLIARYYPRASMATMVQLDSAANKVIRDIAPAHGAAVVEVEGKITPTSASFADYAHFTDAGAAEMARLLASGLLAIDQPTAAPAP